MVQICIGMVRIHLKWFECGFESFESLLNGSNLHSKTLNHIRMFRVCILIPFEWFELYFETESLSNSSIMHSNASSPFRIFRILFRNNRVPFEWFDFAFECFESLSNGLNLHSNARIPFERFEIGFETLESLSNESNLELNASNPFRMVQICIGMVGIPLKWFECGFEASNPF